MNADSTPKSCVVPGAAAVPPSLGDRYPGGPGKHRGRPASRHLGMPGRHRRLQEDALQDTTLAWTKAASC